MNRNFFQSTQDQETINECRSCRSKDFYLQKDFPRKIALTIVVIGMITVPWTYGLSLIGVALIDWIIFRKTPWMTVCYRCRSEYRNYTLNPKHKEFDRHLDELYQYKST